MLDLYVYEEVNSRIFLQNSHFSANSIKTCYFIRFFNIFWSFTNPALRKFRRPEKKFFWGGLIFSDLIYVCVNNKKWLQPFLTDFECVQIILMGMVPFPLFSVYSLILRKKNSGNQKKSSCEVDLFFLNRCTSVLTKKNEFSHLWLILSVYEFFLRAWYFFQNFPGRQQNFQ